MPTVYSPPVSTYVALATTTLPSAVTTVTFSSIPAGYRDLVLVCSLISSNTSANFIGFNGNSYTSNMSYVRMVGDGSNDSSAAASEGIIGWSPQNGAAGSIITHIMDYSATDKHTTYLSRSNGGSWVTGIAGRWAQTAAVTSFTLTAETAQYAIGSTFSLYGIEA